ncbi:unknown protein [Oryza sativa Japonica Group]|jgi:hypothetical protein|uniref:Os01g0102300 protein n=4 Tax=Oryza TaxID=4527 RepID=A0A979HJE2_ORYSJ|nr:thylakoid lumenal 17.9 kDa protein, chloroplastic isoform X2 [Oryza sativa Japonica Group]EAY72172.1 hypothetical protein OsI_00021 [Oryza sativa Indica Group]KAB8082530.1 hypothetical protein EE612_004435 [Oryza sativa]EAZ10191.1 hypothetical protein OsJ_00018 [Oryza sativa Japonica Group]BAB62636.1 P0402A09.21 [Oryza sativa Japonica Group]BAB92138.1 P0455C04.15 [Oryza sativa Japonica Group]|eukprot:NP_001041747.1 Os01g0102300 [Oryza sativa Japonica Group]
MTSSLSSSTASAAACCKSRSRNPPPAPAPHTSTARVVRSSRRRLLLVFFSAEAAAAATSGLIQTPCGQAYPFAGTNVKKPQPPSTPYSQSQSQQQFGLDAKGRIRACPSTNPGCVSTNPTVGASCSLASPLIVPANTPTDKAAASLREAILKTQRNAVIKADEETAYGHYIQAEVDGGAGRDVMEFLLKESQSQSQEVVAAYRCVATKVIFVYPFTTAVGDSRGQSQRIAAVAQELGWYAPDLLNAATADDHSILDY